MTQFSFLSADFAAVQGHAQQAEQIALSDPRGACFYARLALETAVKWMYANDRELRSPYDDNLSALIHEGTFRQVVGNTLVSKARLIKDLGNKAVHDTRAVTEQNSITAVRELFHFSYWLVRAYGRGAKPEAGLRFDPGALPRTKAVEMKTLAAYQQAAKQYLEKEKEREAAEAARIKTEEDANALQAELEQAQAEIARLKEENTKTPDRHDYDEATTRDAFIDLLLNEAGWPLDQERDREYPLKGMPSTSGDGFADYVLWGDDGKPLAVIEAKRARTDARVGQQQAKLYADCLEKESGQRPVIFYTNGFEHWLWDDVNYPPRPVQGFYKKDELELLHQRRRGVKALGSVEIDAEIAGRTYQSRAIRRVGEAFETDKQRKALLVMATGSGKTRTVIALVDQLMRAGRVKRALFLADRVALVNQAAKAFKAHLPHLPPVNLVTDKATDARICISTYPTMMGLIDEMQNGVRRFGTGHFDLIVIDEAHRSVYRKYKAIFDYFDSLLVGLTATPRDEIDRDTYRLFELEKGVPTDFYDLKDAVEDGYLVPPVPVSVPLRIQRQGLRYDDLSEEEKEKWDAIEWSEDGSTPNEVSAAEINQRLFNQDTVDKVLQHLMTHGIKVEEGDRLGKTIIFAKNHKHALFIAERFDANYPHLAGQFARVIDFHTKYAQSLIDDFSTADKAPHIAISVDMLDTGIDVPEVVNLVFFKIVRSKTKFWQMIGRGTRLCEGLFGPGEDKEKFFVFDFCENFEFFGAEQQTSEPVLARSLGEKLFAARLELLGRLEGAAPSSGFGEEGDGYDAGEGALPSTLEDLAKALADRLHAEVAGMSLDNFIVRPKRRYVEKYQDRIAWSGLDDRARDELMEHVAGLPSGIKEDELTARQFDLLLLETQIALLSSSARIVALQKRIVDIAARLESLSNVPMVKAQLPLILDLQGEDFWRNLTLFDLERVRRRLRNLVQLIEAGERRIIYSDFEDEIGEGTEIDLPDFAVGTDKDRFLRKVRFFLKSHEDHITIKKLHMNEQLTAQDLSELERIFLEEGEATPEDIERVKTESGGLGLFIRSLVGLDRAAAKGAFNTFMSGKTLNANQIEFIDLVIDHLADQGTIDPARLYESPFTDIDDKGLSGVFGGADVTDFVAVIKGIAKTAAA